MVQTVFTNHKRLICGFVKNMTEVIEFNRFQTQEI